MSEVLLNPCEIKVYFVDDDRGMVSSISQWLSLSGVKIQAFADPTALMKVVRAGHPCVVVSDIRMPGIDGMELMRLIKGRDRCIPVILITGHGDIPLAVKAMKIGAYEFLQKPFSPERLLEVVQRAQEDYIARLAENVSEKSESIQEDTDFNGDSDSSMVSAGDLSAQVDDFEKRLICAALERNHGVINRVISELNIPRRTLNAKMKKYEISRGAYKNS